MLRNAKLSTQFFIHATPGVSPVPSTVTHTITPSSVLGFSTLGAAYEYYKLKKCVITYWNPQNYCGSVIPGQYLQGIMTKFNNYDNSPIPLDFETAINNSTVKTHYLDGRNTTFSFTTYPKYMDCVKQSSITFAEALPRNSQWLSCANSANVSHRAAVTQWWGASQFGLPPAIANTGYLLYRYTLYFSFRQRVSPYLQ